MSRRGVEQGGSTLPHLGTDRDGVWTATIFDIGGNKYRILAHVDYTRQTVKIEAVMDHQEYDRQSWRKLF